MPQLPSDLPALFTGRHFDRLLIIQSVRWYITFKLSYRDVCELMAERGVTESGARTGRAFRFRGRDEASFINF
ncbi:MAG: hypothetical protein M3430_07970 [Acidobacteriota bacterium]|nr:hypothetical protein [Acidobacteriota bacterium]